MRIIVLVFLVAASCGIPRDVDKTSDRVAQTHVLRVGIDGGADEVVDGFVTRLEQATGARAVREQASLERLVDRLDHDRLDVIVGPVRADALLAEEVALGPPLDGSDPGDHPVAVRAAARNGENRWIMTIEHVSRAAAGK